MVSRSTRGECAARSGWHTNRVGVTLSPGCGVWSRSIVTVVFGDSDPGAAFVELVVSRVNDARRLAAVDATGLLDTGGEEGFDRIAAIAARLLETPFGFVTVVDDRRSFWKACIGVDAIDPGERQNQVDESFCQYVIGLDDVLMVNDTRVDARTKDNPSIESMGVLAWAGAPVRGTDGVVLGTVCVVDTTPRSWTHSDGLLLSELAEIAADEIRSTQVAVAATRSEVLLESILARAPIGFALVDDQMRYLIVNEAFASMNGRSVDDHLGRSVGELSIDGGDDEVATLLGAVLAGGESVAGIEYTRSAASSAGPQRTWWVSCYRLVVGADTRAGMLVEDVTVRVDAHQRAQRLAEITEQLAKTISADDVARIVGSDVAAYFGAAGAVIGVVDVETRSVSILASRGATKALGDIVFTIDDDTAYGAAVRTGELVVVTDAVDRYERFPASPVLGLEASAAVPCIVAEGTVAGVMVVGWAHRIDRNRFPIAQLKTMATLIANVLQRNDVARQRRELIESLQLTLLGTPIAVAGIEVAVRYEAAGDALGFGGDWYDVVPIDPARTALVVGDVAGHDATAAARMSQVRTVISDLLLLDTALDDLFDQADRLLATRSTSTLTTVGVTVINTEDRTITSISAGHLPALLIHPDGTVTTARPSLRPPLTVGRSPLHSVAFDYEPGTKIVMYTDGLIETRAHTIDVDLTRLRQYLEDVAGADVHSLADKLVNDFADPTIRFDDTALICAELQ